MEEPKRTVLSNEEALTLLEQVKQIALNGQGDNFRKEVYNIARDGKLNTSWIVMLKVLRNEEAKLQ